MSDDFLPQLLPADPLGKRLCSIFPYLWQAIAGVNELEPRWQTIQKYALRPRVLWRLWQDAAQLVGVRFDDQTRYALIDIDAESVYHPNQQPESIAIIRAALETIGIYRTLLLRSSWSGGLHLYIPLPELVPTFNLASALKQCFEAQGLHLAPGQLETFPNCKSYALPGTFTEYNAHRLPLQPASGSCLLDADGNPLTTDLSSFFDSWDVAAAAQDMREVRNAIAQAKLNRRGRRHRQSTTVESWRQDLRTEMEEGWSGSGQTNHLLKTIACYGVVFEGLTGDELIEFVHQSAIHSPGYFQWCRHQHEIQMRCMVWARSAAGYYWKLGTEPQRNRHRYGSQAGMDGTETSSLNQLRSEDAQRRIRRAVESLQQQGILPIAATERASAIIRQGAVSLKTLYRYLTLWHPDQRQEAIEVEELRSCKTDQPASSVVIEAGETVESVRSLKCSDSAEFYTSERIMKSDHPNSPSSDSQFIPSPAQNGSSPRFLNPFEPDDPLSDGESFFTSIQFGRHVQLNLLDFLARIPDPAAVELTCTEALLQGDRSWVLRRLLALWTQGHSALVRSIVQVHFDWGFAITPAGLVEVSSHAP